MGQQTEKKLEPRYAKTAEELVFFTNTDEREYPIYLLPNAEIRYKRKPEDAEKFATFYVKGIEVLVGEEGRKVRERVATIFEVERVAKEVGRRAEAYTYSIQYEVYKGDFEELVASVAVPYIKIRIEPPFPSSASFDEKRAWAIAFTTRKRLLQKLPPDVAALVEKYCYLKEYERKRFEPMPHVFIKIPVVTPEFEKVFEEIKAWLMSEELPAGQTEEEEEEKTAGGIADEVVKKILEAAKPQELVVVMEEAPAAPPAPTPTTPTAVGAAAAAREEVPARAELVKLYLLNMRLPSKYLVQRVENEREGDNVREVRRWEGEAAKLAARLQTIRWNAYSAMSRIFAYVEEYGVWIAVSEHAVEEARKVSARIREELAKLGLAPLAERYVVRAVPVYLEPDEARELLSAAVERLSSDVDELKQKIEEAEKEQKFKALKKLEREKEYREALLEAFRNCLASLNSQR
jgi:hypothetical protein